MCDFNCCCDPSCSESIVNEWQMTPSVSCNDFKPIRAPYIPCNSSEFIVNYNRNYGISQYISPLSSMFCVFRDQSPKMSQIYANVTTISEAELLSLQSSTVGFAQSIYAASQSTTSQNYAVNQTMRMSITTASTVTYSAPFVVPRANIFGQCDNSTGAKFMQNVENEECAQIVDLNTSAGECQSNGLLDSGYYTGISLLIGVSPSSTKMLVEISRHWQFLDGVYTALDRTPGTISHKAMPAPGCTCTNYVKEVHYTINVTAPDNTTFTINSAKAEIVYSNYQSSTDCSNISIPQIFSIKFQTGPQNNVIFIRSGSPGYITGKPLLIGQLINNQITIQKYGRYLIGADSSGGCTASQIYGPLIKYGSKLRFQCFVKYDQGALKSNCPSQNPNIFLNQLRDLNVIGKYGSSSVNNSGDWISVSQTLINTAASYTASTKTCSLRVGSQLNILTSEVGFPSNRHNYIISAQLTEYIGQWQYTLSSGKQRFYYFVEINFKSYDQAKESLSNQIQSFASDFSWRKLFEPFYVNRA